MKIKMSRWQMAYEKQPIVDLPKKNKVTEHGSIEAYQYSEIPKDVLNSGGENWENAPGEGGHIDFNKKSILTHAGGNWYPNSEKTTCAKKLNFTYFRAFIFIPAEKKVTSFKVTINQVDDGARMSVYNTLFPKGCIKKNEEGKLNGNKVSADFTKEATTGWNLILITQFDDCPVLNKLTGGVEVLVNNKVVDPDLELHAPSCLIPSYHWASGLKREENQKSATGEINGRAFTYNSSEKIEFENSFQSYDRFPKGDHIPKDIRNIKNTKKSSNSLTFKDPIKDLIVIFASIGSAKLSVNIKFTQEIEIIWSENINILENTISGKEGFAIVKIPGTHNTINFDYDADEYRCNFLFGYAECPDL